MSQLPVLRRDSVVSVRPGRSMEARLDGIAPSLPGTEESVDSRRPALIEFVPRQLDHHEVSRRLWHFAPGFLPLIFAAVPKIDSVPAPLLVFLVAGSLVLTGIAVWYQKSYARSNEKSCLPAIVGYVAPILLVLCLFPDFPELALTLMVIIAFGDGSATLFGLLYGSTRLPWNAEKSWIGTAAFVAVSLPVGVLVYFVTAIPSVPPGVALWCGGMAAIVAAAVESLPLKGNDNLRVGMAAMAGMLLPHLLLVGF